MVVNLSKGNTVSLAKEAPSLTNLHIGLGWDPVKKGGMLGKLFGGGNDSIDLDASLIMFDGSRQVIDEVWFRQLRSNDGSVIHSGDNLTGDGDGDDEVIRVDLTRVPQSVQHLAVTVNSFRGQTFNEVDNAFCRMVDEKSGKEICRFTIREKSNSTGFIMAIVSRSGNGWDVKAVGEPATGRTVRDLAGAAARLL